VASAVCVFQTFELTGAASAEAKKTAGNAICDFVQAQARRD
jgi:hypothetical protein